MCAFGLFQLVPKFTPRGTPAFARSVVMVSDAVHGAVHAALLFFTLRAWLNKRSPPLPKDARLHMICQTCFL